MKVIPTARRRCGTLVAIAVSTEPRSAVHPARSRGFGGGFSLPKSEALAMLAPLLTDPTIEKIGHDSRRLDRARRHGVASSIRRLRHDARELLVRCERPARRWSRLALEHLGTRHSPKTKCAEGRHRRSLLPAVPATACSIRGERADIALQLSERVPACVINDSLNPCIASSSCHGADFSPRSNAPASGGCALARVAVGPCSIASGPT